MNYKRIRSLERGIAVLKFLNTVKAATVAEIAEATQIPRPTAYRVLDALIEEGLVYQRPSSNSLYLLSGNDRLLSNGPVEH